LCGHRKKEKKGQAWGLLTVPTFSIPEEHLSEEMKIIFPCKHKSTAMKNY
jgi:hypothetical protein